MKRGFPHAGIALGALLLIAIAGLAQRGRFGGNGGFGGGFGAIPGPSDDEAVMPARDAEFHFIRLEYTDLPQNHRGFGYASRMGSGSGWWIVGLARRGQSLHHRRRAADSDRHRRPASFDLRQESIDILQNSYGGSRIFIEHPNLLAQRIQVLLYLSRMIADKTSCGGYCDTRI